MVRPFKWQDLLHEAICSADLFNRILENKIWNYSGLLLLKPPLRVKGLSTLKLVDLF